MMMRMASWRSERGVASVLVVGVFLTLLLFVGMSVDYGILLRYRRAMQNGCDAGALAGAWNLKSNLSTVDSTATRYASNDMTQNKLTWDQLTAQTLDSNWQPNNSTPDRVRVNIHATVPTYFYRLVRANVGVAIECTAQITPVNSLSGLQPIGLNYNVFVNFFQNTLGGAACTISPPDPRPACQQDFALTVTTNSQSFGSGNTGLLGMTNSSCSSSGGSSLWACVFQGGTTQSFCFDKPNLPQSSWTACAQVTTDTGEKIAAINAGLFGSSTQPNGRCMTWPNTPTPAPPNPASQWIVLMPLLNPAYTSCTGNCTTDVNGFVAFELDCPVMSKFTGNNATIYGKFVNLVAPNATGGGSTSSGIFTVKLVE